MPAKRSIGVVIMAAAVLFSSGCGLGDGSNGAIRISGNVEMTEVKVSFKTSGKLVERSVGEGDSVEQGATVAKLDPEQVLRQRDQAQAALDAARSQLTQLHTAINYQEETVEAQIEAQRAAQKQAEAQLAELESGSRVQEIEQAAARRVQAQTELERASADWERAQPLMEADDISRAQYDQFRQRFESARAQVQQAEEALALVKEGPRKETIERARAQVEQSAAAVRLAEAQRIELKRRQQEIGMRQAEVERAAAQLALIETQLADTIATAPVSGVVLSKAAEVGEVLAAGTTVLTIGDMGRPWLRGYIDERDLGRVKIGQGVRVTTDSYPGKVYDGRVTFISSEAEFTPKQIQTEQERMKLVYRIKVEVDNPNQELKLNMPADAEIVPATDGRS